MRALTNAFMLALILCLLGGCACTVDPLVGTWERVDEEGRPTGQIKILNDTHFALATPGDRDDDWTGGGLWHRADSAYFETILYHYHTDIVGRTIKFECRMEEDLWYHSGEFRAEGTIFSIDEIWRRIPRDENEPAKKED